MNPKIFLLLLLMSGCAAVNRQVEPTALSESDPADRTAVKRFESEAEAQAYAAAHRRKLVCAMERPTGSNIAERVCRYRDEIDEAARQTQLGLLNLPKSCDDMACKGK